MKKFKWLTYKEAEEKSFDIGNETVWIAGNKITKEVEIVISNAGYFRSASKVYSLIWNEWLYAGPIDFSKLIDINSLR